MFPTTSNFNRAVKLDWLNQSNLAELKADIATPKSSKTFPGAP
jgi:hypothetical protein